MITTMTGWLYLLVQRGTFCTSHLHDPVVYFLHVISAVMDVVPGWQVISYFISSVLLYLRVRTAFFMKLMSHPLESEVSSLTTVR